MASIQVRVDEANKLLEEGHKHLKTNLLKWHPDHDNAASMFCKAAAVFKSIGTHEKVVEAYRLAIKSYTSTTAGDLQAAKCYEHCALSHKELNNYREVFVDYMKAIDLYKEHGRYDCAISVLQKGAKIMQAKEPSKAADLLIQASEFCALEDRNREAAELCSKAASLYLKTRAYEKSAKILREEIRCLLEMGSASASQSAMSLILCELKANNIVGANDVLKSIPMDTEAHLLAVNLIKAYDKKDRKEIHAVLNNYYFKILDTEFAKLARDIQNDCDSQGEASIENDGVKADDDEHALL